ncbi:MAG: hypothetical protein AAF602_25885, partial [Myxococcota bacterium]
MIHRLLSLSILVACAAEPPQGTTPPLPSRPCFALDVGTLGFGEVRFGDVVPDQTLTIANPCGEALEITRLELVDEAGTTIFQLVEPPELPARIEATGTLEVVVTGAPPRYGRFYDVIEIDSTDPQVPGESVALLLDAVCEGL